MTNNAVFERWLDRPIPPIPADQLEIFRDLESIDGQIIAQIEPSAIITACNRQIGAKVLGIDLGGGSVRGAVFRVGQAGSLELTDDFSQITEAERGAGFLEQLEAFAAYSKKHNLGIGMSYGGPIDGTVPRDHPKIPELMRGLRDRYDGDFANLFDAPFALLNDGPAGLLRSVEKAIRNGHDDPTVLYLINGGGLGIGAYRGGTLYATEAGHAACVDALNRNVVQRQCGLYGDHVCLENVVSNKQGLEGQWQAHSGEHLSGREIEDRARSGDHFAMDLFEQGALAEAALLRGVAKVLDIDIHDPQCDIVVHGGFHRTPFLLQRIAQIVWQTAEPKRQIEFTENFDPNACMHGAALQILINAALRNLAN